MFRAIRNVARLLGIVRTLARHDALFPLEALTDGSAITATARLVVRLAKRKRTESQRPGQRLSLALQELGPSFIKFGQSLATRADLIGDELATDLSQLQDHLPPFPTDQARRTIEDEIESPIDELFTSFDDVPVAAASIAQVHFAVTSDGREVAVKVLRPGIEDAFVRDLDLFLWLAETIENSQPSLRRLKPVEVVQTFARVVRTEMDLRLEAAAAVELAENFADDPSFNVPEIDWQRTAKRVLTLARVEGIPIDQRDDLIKAGHDPRAVVETTSRAIFHQIFRDGFFHADLHPGNLFVAADGSIHAVDFGIMGRLDATTRRYLGEMLMGFLEGDYRRVSDMHFRAGYVPASQSRDEFMQACRAIGSPIIGKPLNEISLARLLSQLFAITEAFEMETQPQLLLLQKTMMVAEGIGRMLDANINMWEMSRPLISEWIEANLSAEAILRTAAKEVATGIERLPHLIRGVERTAEMVAEGGIRLHPDSVRGLTQDGNSRRGGSVALWLILAVLATILVVIL